MRSSKREISDVGSRTETLWSDAFPRASGSFYSSPVVANGILYAAREDGTVFTARIENGFELLSENAMGERIVASPIPAGNRLLLRTNMGAGHGGASGRYDFLREVAFKFAFLLDVLEIEA